MASKPFSRLPPPHSLAWGEVYHTEWLPQSIPEEPPHMPRRKHELEVESPSPPHTLTLFELEVRERFGKELHGWKTYTVGCRSLRGQLALAPRSPSRSPSLLAPTHRAAAPAEPRRREPAPLQHPWRRRTVAACKWAAGSP